MLDIKLIRENPDIVRKDLKKRQDKGKLGWLEDLIKKDGEYRDLLKKVEGLRHRRNVISKEIANAKKKKKDVKNLIKEAKEIPKKLEGSEKRVVELRNKSKYYLMRLPNIMHKSVPFGKSEEDNKTIRTFGKKPKFKFKAKSHVDLIESLDIADIERAAKVSGARFYYLKGELAMLDLALQKFALDYLSKKGFTAILPPFAIKRKPYEGVTSLDDFEEMLYKIEGEDLYLIATSEHPIAAMHMNEVIDEKKLPLSYAGVSQCFRKEAGAHGKDTKGIFRVHQFNKIEQFVFCKKEDSWKEYEKLIDNAEYLCKKLGLPYRIVNICTAELGIIAAKKYDLELWMPLQNKYREAVSCSNCTDYQARRLNIKVGKVGGEKEVLHTLNSTAIATTRIAVAIIENFQQKDGSVKIPRALWPYMNGVKKIKPKNA